MNLSTRGFLAFRFLEEHGIQVDALLDVEGINSNNLLQVCLTTFALDDLSKMD